MYPFYDSELSEKVIPVLEKNCPSPEGDLNALSKLAGHTKSDALSYQFNRITLDIEDLICQIRWHLGQALCLMELYKQFETRPTSPLDVSAPVNVFMLLRPYISEVDKVFFPDLAEPRRGGTAAGWIFHMMIDNVIYRSIAGLDRIAHLLWGMAMLKESKVYFRSGKLKAIAKVLGSEVDPLITIAESDLFDLILNYRDGFTHQSKAYSLLSGTIPAKPEFRPASATDLAWDMENLFALGNASYQQFVSALHIIVPICERQFPPIE